MASRSVVLAFFNDEVAADDAAEQMKAWYKANSGANMSSIGVLVLDDKGKIKTHKLGSRSISKGAGIGLLLAVIAPPTLLAGVIGGGLLGAFHHKGLGLKSEDRDRIAAQLAGGKAAVGVLASDYEATAVVAKLGELGGTPESYEVPAEAIAEVEAVVPEVEAAEVAAGDDLTIIDGIGPVTSDALRAAGVTTFAQVGAMTPEAIEEQLDKANASLIAGHHAEFVAAPGQARRRGRLGRTAALHCVDQAGHILNRSRPSGRTTCPSTPPVIVAGGVSFPWVPRPS